jgi:uncharacterized protein YbcI
MLVHWAVRAAGRLGPREFVSDTVVWWDEAKRGSLGGRHDLLPAARAIRHEGGDGGVNLSDVSTQFPTVGAMASAISNAAVRLLTEYTGRGPTKARTYINENLITVVLQDTLTRGEHSLVEDGETQLVLANRKAYQRVMGSELTASVERISGRRVLAFLSDNHVDPDYAVEAFVLAPLDGSGSRGGSPQIEDGSVEAEL